MSQLTIYHQDSPDSPLLATDDAQAIAAELDKVGVAFTRWPVEQLLPAEASPEQIGDAYRPEIEKLLAAGGYQTWDVIGLHPAHPDKDAMRKKFLDEHTHSEDEVRFFVDGAGQFTLHIEDKVYEVLCTAGDLMSVPAGTRHWFDMGPNPLFKVIRVFNNQEGWVAKFTGADIAGRFPRLKN